jgi:hypothetical protein
VTILSHPAVGGFLTRISLAPVAAPPPANPRRRRRRHCREIIPYLAACPLAIHGALIPVFSAHKIAEASEL